MILSLCVFSIELLLERFGSAIDLGLEPHFFGLSPLTSSSLPRAIGAKSVVPLKEFLLPLILVLELGVASGSYVVSISVFLERFIK